MLDVQGYLDSVRGRETGVHCSNSLLAQQMLSRPTETQEAK